MKIIADLHTHSLVSQHAYSTIDELSIGAKEMGLIAFAITDHTDGIKDGAYKGHFICLRELPDYINGIRLYKGAEVNIMDYEGTLDLSERIMEKLDFVIASMHYEAIKPEDIDTHTKGWLKVIENPHVDCLGHIGQDTFIAHYEEIVLACKKHNKIIEINSNSFDIRPGSHVNCREVALLCMKHEVKIAVNSDSHSKYNIGNFDNALQMLESINFPEELVINASRESLFEYFASK